MIESDLRDFIVAVPEIRAFLGAGYANAVSPLHLPQGVKRGLVYTLVSKVRNRTADGRSGLCSPARFQLEMIDLESDGSAPPLAAYKLAKDAMAALWNVLDGYAGPMSDSVVQLAEVEADRDSWDESVRAYVVGFDVLLHFDEG